MSHTTQPITHTPGGQPHTMDPSPRYLTLMADLLRIIDRAYQNYWLKNKTPGLFEAKALFKDLMTAYALVVEAGGRLSRRSGPLGVEATNTTPATTGRTKVELPDDAYEQPGPDAGYPAPEVGQSTDWDPRD